MADSTKASPPAPLKYEESSIRKHMNDLVKYGPPRFPDRPAYGLFVDGEHMREQEMQKVQAALQETKEAWTEPTAERRMTLRSVDARAERTPSETVEIASPLHRLALEALSFRYILSLLERDSPLLKIFEDVVPDLDNNANFTWGGANPEEYDAEEDDLAPRE